MAETFLTAVQTETNKETIIENITQLHNALLNLYIEACFVQV